MKAKLDHRAFAPVYVHPRRDLIAWVPPIPRDTMIGVNIRPETAFKLTGVGMINGNVDGWRVHQLYIGNEPQLAFVREIAQLDRWLDFKALRGAQTILTFKSSHPGTEIRTVLSHIFDSPTDCELMFVRGIPDTSLILGLLPSA